MSLTRAAIEQLITHAVGPVADELAALLVQLNQGGPPASSANVHVHAQSMPSHIWTIDHNLGHYPVIVVIDSAGDECEGERDDTSAAQTVITFSAAFSGVATCV